MFKTLLTFFSNFQVFPKSSYDSFFVFQICVGIDTWWCWLHNNDNNDNNNDDNDNDNNSNSNNNKKPKKRQ